LGGAGKGHTKRERGTNEKKNPHSRNNQWKADMIPLVKDGIYRIASLEKKTSKRAIPTGSERRETGGAKKEKGSRRKGTEKREIHDREKARTSVKETG